MLVKPPKPLNDAQTGRLWKVSADGAARGGGGGSIPLVKAGSTPAPSHLPL